MNDVHIPILGSPRAHLQSHNTSETTSHSHTPPQASTNIAKEWELLQAERARLQAEERRLREKEQQLRQLEKQLCIAAASSSQTNSFDKPPVVAPLPSSVFRRRASVSSNTSSPKSPTPSSSTISSARLSGTLKSARARERDYVYELQTGFAIDGNASAAQHSNGSVRSGHTRTNSDNTVYQPPTRQSSLLTVPTTDIDGERPPLPSSHEDDEIEEVQLVVVPPSSGNTSRSGSVTPQRVQSGGTKRAQRDPSPNKSDNYTNSRLESTMPSPSSAFIGGINGTRVGTTTTPAREATNGTSRTTTDTTQSSTVPMFRPWGVSPVRTRPPSGSTGVPLMPVPKSRVQNYVMEAPLSLKEAQERLAERERERGRELERRRILKLRRATSATRRRSGNTETSATSAPNPNATSSNVTNKSPTCTGALATAAPIGPAMLVMPVPAESPEREKDQKSKMFLRTSPPTRYAAPVVIVAPSDSPRGGTNDTIPHVAGSRRGSIMKTYTPEDEEFIEMIGHTSAAPSRPGSSGSEINETTAALGVSGARQSREGSGNSPVLELLKASIDEETFARMLEDKPSDQRRVSIQDLAHHFKRVMTLLAFTSNVSKELNVDKAMHAIAVQVRDILKADWAALYFIDGVNNECWTKAPAPAAAYERDKSKSTAPAGDIEIRQPRDSGIVGYVARSGDMVNMRNVATHSHFNAEYDRRPNLHKHSVLCIPIYDVSDGNESNANGGDTATAKPNIIAVLEAANKVDTTKSTPALDSSGFSKEDEIIMKALAIQTANCLRSVQLYTSTTDAQHKIEVLLEVAKQLSSYLETTPLITTIMKKARELLDADRCTLFLVDKENKELWSKVAEGEREIRFPMHMGIAGHVATTGTVLNIPDAYKDSRFNPDIDRKTGYRTRSLLCMPLRGLDGDIVGVTQMINKKRGSSFDESDVKLLDAFSAQAAVALENALLFQRTKEISSFLEGVLKSITNLVITLDLSGKLVTANHASRLVSIFGVDEAAMKRAPYSEWLGEHNQMMARDIQYVYQHPEVESGITVNDYELKVSSASTSTSINYTVVPFFDGKMTRTQKGVVLVIEDITPQKRMMTTLGRYMSPALAEQVVKEGGMRLGGVHLTVTTLFVDIRNFTGLSERMDAGAVVDLLNEYFSHMVTAIFEQGGVLDKYIGDAVMAVFGVPFEQSDDAVRACRAALQMLTNLRRFNENRAAQGKEPINVGIGLNTGRVLSGNIGSEKRLEYTVIGDGVNIASRLEGATKTYGVQILLSEFTYADVKGVFLVREIDLIRVVGKNQPVRIYELLGEKDTQNEAFAPTSTQQLLLKAMTYWDAGLQAYRNFDFALAMANFEKCDTLTGGDNPSKVFISRCRQLLHSPPGKDWDGVWVMTEK